MLEVGRIARAHGLRGEVVVSLITDRLERLEPGSVLQTDRGSLRVEASRPHGRAHIVAFVGVGDRTAAEALMGRSLQAEAIEGSDDVFVHELIGSHVVELDGTDRGPVIGVLANPASDLLELESGALVPLTFVTDVSAGRVLIDAPEGLFDA